MFPRPTTCTHVYPDGREERVRYGYTEVIIITHENGWPVNRNEIRMPRWIVSEVTKEDGTIVIFDEPFFTIEEQYFGDGSGREAKRSY